MKLSKQFILGVVLFSSNLTFSQTRVGINTQNPTQTLDVNGNARIRNMTDVNTQMLALGFNRKIVANADGNLGYILNRSEAVPWMLIDNKFTVLTQPITSTIEGGRVNLNFSVPVTIPAMSEAQVVINYNVPVKHSSAAALTINYIGCTTYKSTNGDGDIELEMGSRKFTVPGSYNGGTGVVGYMGMPIAGFAIDIISNPSNNIINLVYKVDGYIEGNRLTAITFGTGEEVALNGLNLGRGVMSAQIFAKPLP